MAGPSYGLLARIRAGKPPAAATVSPPSVLVVGDSPSHGRTAIREPLARARWLRSALGKDLTASIADNQEGV